MISQRRLEQILRPILFFTEMILDKLPFGNYNISNQKVTYIFY